MKRHPSLQPFSRDHNVSLVLARRLQREPGDFLICDFLRIWRDELEDHFAEEERILLRYVDPDQRERMIREHESVRKYATAARRGMLDLADMIRLGRLIDEHVRWEERSLFPFIEANSTEADLAQIAEETSLLEARRATSVHAPRRGELMNR